VFNRRERTLLYASGGHPPALLIDHSHQQIDLDTHGMPVGVFRQTKYDAPAVQVPPDSSVYVFSDGCYEIYKSDGDVGTREEMSHYLSKLSSDDLPQLEALYRHSLSMQGGESLEDDFSIMCAMFR